MGAGPVVAYTASAGLFAFAHPKTEPSAHLALNGFILARIYHGTGIFALPVALHMLWNSLVSWRGALLGPLHPLGLKEDRPARRQRLLLGQTIAKAVDGAAERIVNIGRAVSLWYTPLLDNGELHERAMVATNMLVENAVAGAAPEEAATRIASALLEANGRNAGLRTVAERAMRNACDVEITRRLMKRQGHSSDGSVEADVEALRYSESMLEEYIEDFNATLGQVYEFAAPPESEVGDLNVSSNVHRYIQQLAILSPRVAARVLGLDETQSPVFTFDSLDSPSTDIPPTPPAHSLDQNG